MRSTTRTFIALAASAGILAGATAPSLAQAMHGPAMVKPAGVTAAVEQVGWRYNGGRRVWVGPRGNWGAGVAAGAIGLAAGAIIGTAISSANQDAEYNQWLAYCKKKYHRGFDEASGTYLASDGKRYPCE
jgi:hypothetical protein